MITAAERIAASILFFLLPKISSTFLLNKLNHEKHLLLINRNFIIFKLNPDLISALYAKRLEIFSGNLSLFQLLQFRRLQNILFPDVLHTIVQTAMTDLNLQNSQDRSKKNWMQESLMKILKCQETDHIEQAVKARFQNCLGNVLDVVIVRQNVQQVRFAKKIQV